MTNTPPPAPADFVQLATDAFDPHGNPRSIDAMNRLWAATLRLPEWHVLLDPRVSVADAIAANAAPTPFIYEVGGKRWLFAFTDTDKLAAFARQNNLAGSDGPRFLSMPSRGCQTWLEGFGPAVFGVHFNFGGPGFFSPLGGIAGIRTFLVAGGLLEA